MNCSYCGVDGRYYLKQLKELEDCQCSVGNIISETLRCVSCNKEIISQQADLLEIEHLEAKVKELEISAEVDRDLVGAVDSLSEENTKLKAEQIADREMIIHVANKGKKYKAALRDIADGSKCSACSCSCHAYANKALSDISGKGE